MGAIFSVLLFDKISFKSSRYPCLNSENFLLIIFKFSSFDFLYSECKLEISLYNDDCKDDVSSTQVFFLVNR